MKKLLLLIFIFLSTTILSQNIDFNIQHEQSKNFFPPCWNEPEWTWTYSVMAVYTSWGKVSIQDSEKGLEFPLKLGDWVGVFCTDLDGSLKCCGANQWLYEDQNLGINLVSDETSTPKHKEGLYENEEMIIKIYRWDIYDELYSDIIHYKCYPNIPNYDCDGLFNDGMLYVVDTLIIEENLDQQNIILHEGWDVISSYIKPIDKNIETTILPIFDNFIILKNLYGQVYWKLNNSTIINNMNNWRYENGYSIKMNNYDTLKIYGKKIDNINLNYENQWVNMPIPFNNTYNVEDVFPDLYKQKTGIIKYKQFVYWPYYGINTLIYLEPGKGYMSHFTTSTSPIFNNKKINITKKSDIEKWKITYTNNTNIILIENIENVLNIGEYIAVFDDNNNCFGYTNYNGGKNISIIAFGDDNITNIKDGFYIDDNINFKILTLNNDLIDFKPYFENLFSGNQNILYGEVITTDININYFNNLIIEKNGNNIIIKNDFFISYSLYDITGKLIKKETTNENIIINNNKKRVMILNIIYNNNSYNYKII
jgi:hypothetical protein